MSLQTLERMILTDAKILFKNPKLRMKDILEWSTGDIKPQEGEVVVWVKTGANVAILKTNDKRDSLKGFHRK